jgi:hypothetical protein
LCGLELQDIRFSTPNVSLAEVQQQQQQQQRLKKVQGSVQTRKNDDDDDDDADEDDDMWEDSFHSEVEDDELEVEQEAYFEGKWE